MTLCRYFIPLGLALAACNGNNNPDAGLDAAQDGVSVDASDGPSGDNGLGPIQHLAVSQTFTVAGLDQAVDVVVDHHGWPHIYAHTLHDAMYVNGYLVARDRMAQMDLIRRSASGTLADAFGALSAGLIDQDIATRVVGLRRTAQQMYDMIQPGRAKTALDAYTLGVNRYLGEIRSGMATAAVGTELVVNSGTPDWTAVDSLVVARYQAFALSYEGDTDIQFNHDRTSAAMAFDSASAGSPASRRAGLFWDMHRFQPPSSTVILPNFNASMGLHDTYRPDVFAPRVSNAVYHAAQPWLDGIRAARGLIARADRGSNNWVVAGSASTTGHAMLENDPHLQLTGPAVWWGVHFTVVDGPDAVDVAGVSFPGIPGLILGYNRNVAWGATVTNYDVTDVYQETITNGTGSNPSTVLNNGTQVPITVIHEMVSDGLGHVIDEPIEVGPHGPLVPTIANGHIVPRTATTALSVRWTGAQPTHDLDAVVGLWYASTVEEARTALTSFDVGAQNWVLADTHGNIGYTTHSIVPQRAAGAMTWAPDTAAHRLGTLPCDVLPGTGAADWTGVVNPAQLPNAVNSATLQWINTSNNDHTGDLQDNNPLDHSVYYGCNYADGWRAEQVAARLTALNNHISPMDMISIQNDHVSLMGGRYRPFLATAITALTQQMDNPTSHLDLASLAISLAPHRAQLVDAAARIAAWSLDTPSGLETNATDANRADAIATSIFHAWYGHVQNDAINDEATAVAQVDPAAGIGWPIRGLLFILEHPTQAVSFDATTGDSNVWDDLGTPATTETRNYILARALDEALTDLAHNSGSTDPAQWLWGKFHFVQFVSIVPGPGAGLSIPPTGDTTFPHGFPRPGEYETVDVANSNYTFPYVYGSGPSQRFTVEMDPAGPHGFNALPGGQQFDTTAPHFRDEAELWRVNQVHAVPRSVPEVVTDAESHLVFNP